MEELSDTASIFQAHTGPIVSGVLRDLEMGSRLCAWGTRPVALEGRPLVQWRAAYLKASSEATSLGEGRGGRETARQLPSCLQRCFWLNCRIRVFCPKGWRHKHKHFPSWGCPSHLPQPWVRACAAWKGNSGSSPGHGQHSNVKAISPSGAGKPYNDRRSLPYKGLPVVKIHLGGNKFELNLLKPENVNQGTFLMKLQCGLETIFKLHFEIQVCFCTELITRGGDLQKPGFY